MTLAIIFEPWRFPRTMSRAEWQAEYHNYRAMRNTWRQLDAKQAEMLTQVIHPTIRAAIIDNMINPPVYIIPPLRIS